MRDPDRRAAGNLRILAGSLKGRRLACPSGLVTRPTSGLVRGALFNILAGLLPGAEVLDLYAGTGALGLEALSRGAAHAVLVEGDRQAIGALRKNIESMGAGSRADLVAMDALAYLDRCRSRFDLVLADPPYAEDLTEALLSRIAASEILKEDGVAVLQEASRRPACQGVGPLSLWKSRVYGRTRLSFYLNQQEQ